MLTHEQDLIRQRVLEVAELIRSSKEEHRCIRCNQKLTDSESIERQMGPDCWKQMNAASEIRVIYGHSDEYWHERTTWAGYEMDGHYNHIMIFAWCPRCEHQAKGHHETMVASSFEDEAADEVRDALHGSPDPAGQEILAQFIMEGAVDQTSCDQCCLDYTELKTTLHPSLWASSRRRPWNLPDPSAAKWPGAIRVWSERDDLMEVYQDSMR